MRDGDKIFVSRIQKFGNFVETSPITLQMIHN